MFTDSPEPPNTQMALPAIRRKTSNKPSRGTAHLPNIFHLTSSI